MFFVRIDGTRVFLNRCQLFDGKRSSKSITRPRCAGVKPGAFPVGRMVFARFRKSKAKSVWINLLESFLQFAGADGTACRPSPLVHLLKTGPSASPKFRTSDVGL